MFFSGLARTYCKAGPPVTGANPSRYELKTVMPMNTDVNKVMALQRIMDKAMRKRMEMDCLNRERGINELEDEFHGAKKTNDGSIRLVCLSVGMRMRTLTSMLHQRVPYVYPKLTDSYGGASDWVTSVGPKMTTWQCYTRVCRRNKGSNQDKWVAEMEMGNQCSRQVDHHLLRKG
eukprot:6463625-Amphidinium_carterae.1